MDEWKTNKVLTFFGRAGLDKTSITCVLDYPVDKVVPDAACIWVKALPKGTLCCQFSLKNVNFSIVRHPHVTCVRSDLEVKTT